MPIPSVSVLKRRTDDGKNGEYKTRYKGNQNCTDPFLRRHRQRRGWYRHRSLCDRQSHQDICLRIKEFDKKGIKRYGYFLLPMDDALVACAVDLCGRPYFNFDYEFNVPMIGGLDTQLIREFFYAVSYSAGMNLHIKVLDGINGHHVAEAMFKAFSKALDMAVSNEPRLDGVLSTKGSL